jgi:hypothetical protein
VLQRQLYEDLFARLVGRHRRGESAKLCTADERDPDVLQVS